MSTLAPTLALSFLALSAQEPPKPRETALPEVKVKGRKASEIKPETTASATRTETPLKDIPQAITVVPKAVVETQGATTLRDALKNVSGITSAAGEGGNAGDTLNLRGFSARSDIYLDGFRERGQYFRDPFFLESIEVLKGPSSMTFGRGSTGGAINQTSKQAGRRTVREVSVMGGANALGRLTADVNMPMGETSGLRLNLLGHGAKSTREVVKSDRVGIAPAFRTGIGTSTELAVSALHLNAHEIPDYGFPLLGGRPVDVPKDRFFGFQQDRLDQKADVATLRISHRLSSNLRLRTQIQAGRSTVDTAPSPVGLIGLDGKVPSAATPYSQILVTRNRPERVVQDRNLFSQTDLVAVLAGGSITHTLLTGFELGREQSDVERYSWTNLPRTPLLSPVSRVDLAGATRAWASLAETTARSTAFYVQDQVDMGETWKALLGLRWDRFTADYRSRTPAAVLKLSSEDTLPSGRAGVIWQPEARQSYYLSYGTSFNPSAEALTLAANTANLDPEKNHTWELGAKWELLEGALGLTAAAFRTEKTNARTVDPLNATLQILDGRQRVEGLEVGALGRLTESWQLFATAAWMDPLILKSNDVQSGVRIEGKTLQNTPRFSASLWTTWTAGRLELGGGLQHMGRRFGNHANTVVVEGQTRLDAMASWQVRKDVSLRLNLQNLTDALVWDSVSGGRVVPGQGRSASLALTARF